MYQNFATTAFLHVLYRPYSNELVGRWLCSVTEEQLREGYETMRQAALHHHCGCWHIDSRRRPNRRRNGPEWVITQFLPRVQQELACPLRVAFLVLPDHYRDAEAANPSQPSAFNGATPFQFARFTDEGAANTWLSQR
ncbi:hypothetical protein [Hymenobacter sp. B1770]|uniref:hypothetical protein n=1 Tax=Hymenobacter sp. B1770 TaxID=1718788 RepID=UPI003CEAE22D